MAATAFAPSRDDGRSDARVLFDLSERADYGTVLTYDFLTDALSEGLDGTVPRKRLYKAVAAANELLLPERKRYLHVVTGIGYRVAKPSDHVGIALQRRDRAHVQMTRGLELIRNADFGEMTGQERALAEGTLKVLGGLVQAIEASHQRHARAESLITELQQRVDRLEGKGNDD